LVAIANGAACSLTLDIINNGLSVLGIGATVLLAPSFAVREKSLIGSSAVSWRSSSDFFPSALKAPPPRLIVEPSASRAS